MKTLFTTEEAAQLLNLSKSAINKSRVTGMLSGVRAPAHIKIGKKTVRYDLETLQAWMDQLPEHASTSSHDQAA